MISSAFFDNGGGIKAVNGIKGIMGFNAAAIND